MQCFKTNKGGKTTENLIGYKIYRIKSHLENQFDKNMNWNNYGKYWQIDHIVPVNLYDLSNPIEIKKCWSLKNLRPLEKMKNLIKSNKLSLELIEEYNLHDILPKTS